MERYALTAADRDLLEAQEDIESVKAEQEDLRELYQETHTVAGIKRELYDVLERIDLSLSDTGRALLEADQYRAYLRLKVEVLDQLVVASF
jgi:hypothetical protein